MAWSPAGVSLPSASPDTPLAATSVPAAPAAHQLPAGLPDDGGAASERLAEQLNHLNLQQLAEQQPAVPADVAGAAKNGPVMPSHSSKQQGLPHRRRCDSGGPGMAETQDTAAAAAGASSAGDGDSHTSTAADNAAATAATAAAAMAAKPMASAPLESGHLGTELPQHVDGDMRPSAAGTSDSNTSSTEAGSRVAPPVAGSSQTAGPTFRNAADVQFTFGAAGGGGNSSSHGFTPGKVGARYRKQHTPGKAAQPSATAAAAAAPPQQTGVAGFQGFTESARGQDAEPQREQQHLQEQDPGPDWQPEHEQAVPSSVLRRRLISVKSTRSKQQQQQQEEEEGEEEEHQFVQSSGAFAFAAPAPAFTVGATAAGGKTPQRGVPQPRRPSSAVRRDGPEGQQQRQQQQQQKQQQQQQPAVDEALRSAEKWVQRARVSWDARCFEQSEGEFTQVAAEAAVSALLPGAA
jgi:hypothetical protein